MKFFAFFVAIFGAILLLISAAYGLAFGGIFLEHGPVIQGWIGGLIPTITAICGCYFLQFSWKMFEIRSYDGKRASMG